VPPTAEIVAKSGPPGKCRAAYLTTLSVLMCLPAAAREEAEQRQDEDDDQDDPENAHVVASLSVVYLAEIFSAPEQRQPVLRGTGN
jgi:hypothetical protein